MFIHSNPLWFIKVFSSLHNAKVLYINDVPKVLEDWLFYDIINVRTLLQYVYVTLIYFYE